MELVSDVPSGFPICGFGGVLFLGNEILAWGFELPRADGKKWAERVGKQQLVLNANSCPTSSACSCGARCSKAAT